MAAMMSPSLSYTSVLHPGPSAPQQPQGPQGPRMSDEDREILRSQVEVITAFLEENIVPLLGDIFVTYDTQGAGDLDVNALSVFARDFLVANASVTGQQGEPPSHAIQGTVAAWHANLKMDPKNAATNVVTASQFTEMCKGLLGQGISAQPRAVLALFKSWGYEVTLPEFEKTSAQREIDTFTSIVEDNIRPHIPGCFKAMGVSGRGALGTVGFLPFVEATATAMEAIGASKMAQSVSKVPEEHWKKQLLSKNEDGNTVFNQSVACTIACGFAFNVLANPKTRGSASDFFRAWGLDVQLEF